MDEKAVRELCCAALSLATKAILMMENKKDIERLVVQVCKKVEALNL